ncbi:HTH CENPB-type domain-containing protein [Trichonephila clavata]|uniref:HTH CENPB-type domain-containing protein n=1 Tax=Trichonephila clavata TaxID=2740835 RepID=A0A8X6FIU1_TRICU|nr:HTH CENPB-type domain-containing protein [Trichonephila clavata]
MNETSAYINSDVFMKFLKKNFIPRKESGKVLLILDSHASVCSDMVALDLSAENGVILFCLPIHITECLQSLDRSFFTPLKICRRQALSSLIHTKPSDTEASRLQFGSLLKASWSKAASVEMTLLEFQLLTFTPITCKQSHSMCLLFLRIPAMMKL